MFLGAASFFLFQKMQKEFGKLTADQLRQLIGFLPVMAANLRVEFEADLSQHPEKLTKLAPDKLNWASAYELPFAEHLSLLNFIMGGGPQLHAAAISDDPQQVILDATNDEPPEFAGGPGGAYKLQDVFSLLYGIVYSSD